MSRSTVEIRCCLCFTKSEKNGDDLIWYDSLQLCPNCYDRFATSGYNQRVMLINSLKCYRRLISKYEDNGNIQLDANFEGIDANLKSKEILKNLKNEEKSSDQD